MRSTLALLAVASLLTLALPASAASSAMDDARCSGGLCDTINRHCGGCIPSDEATSQPSDCAPEPCGTLNSVCRKTLHADCVRAAPMAFAAESEARCMGPVCDAVNAVCWVALKMWCVG